MITDAAMIVLACVVGRKSTYILARESNERLTELVKVKQ